MLAIVVGTESGYSLPCNNMLGKCIRKIKEDLRLDLRYYK